MTSLDPLLLNPVRVSMMHKGIGACTGVLYKRALDSLETGSVTQMWIKFDNSLIADKYIKDECISCFDVIHPHRDGVFKGAVWERTTSAP